MIPKAFLTAWRKQHPWPDDLMVEQDLIISRILTEMYSNTLVADWLAFRGGTALHKLYFSPAGRYSEDVDLLQLKPGPAGPFMKAIREILDEWLGNPSTRQSYGRITLRYRYLSESEPRTRRNIKIEINTREHFTVMGAKQRPFSVSNPWFSGQVDITTFSLEELLGTKLRALYQRKKGRDLFDLAMALSTQQVDPVSVVDIFLGYMNYQDRSVSRAEGSPALLMKNGFFNVISDIYG